MKHAQVMIGTVAALLLAVGVATAPAQPQLSGTWVLDRAQSQLPSHEGQNKPSPDAQAPPPEVKLRVEQQGTAVKVTINATLTSVPPKPENGVTMKPIASRTTLRPPAR